MKQKLAEFAKIIVALLTILAAAGASVIPVGLRGRSPSSVKTSKTPNLSSANALPR